MQIQLSISLLASNRVYSLRRCLDSLVPILRNVPSELIIVHTSDNMEVRKVAEEYTDQVISFTWCDDFAAARNAGLAEAVGEWFMFIDDDEWFDDTTEIQQFFLSGEYKQYKTALYTVRNYNAWDGLRYSDYHAPRMARREPNVKFCYPIHEILRPFDRPQKDIEAFVHHYGYVYGAGKNKKTKVDRNLPLLLEEIKKNPDSLQVLFQLTQEYLVLQDWKQMEYYCKKALTIAKKKGARIKADWPYAYMIYALIQGGSGERALREGERMITSAKLCEMASAFVFSSLAYQYAAKEQWRKALEQGHQYEEVLSYMDQNPSLWEDQRFGGVLTEEEMKSIKRLYMVRIACVQAAVKEKDQDEAKFFLERLSWDKEYQIQQYYPLLESLKEEWEETGKILQEIHIESSYTTFCQAERAKEADVKRNLFLKSMAMTEDLWLRSQIMEKMLEAELSLGEIAALMDLETWERVVTMAISKCTLNQADDMWKLRPFGLKEGSTYELWLSKQTQEIRICQSLWSGDKLWEELNIYVADVIGYYQAQYNKAMFEPDRRKELPRGCQFALYIKEAIRAKEEKKMAEAVRHLNQGTQINPLFTGVVREMIHEMTKEMDNPAEGAGEEFAALGAQMKAMLQQMCRTEKYEEALQVLQKLLPIMPEDREILRMKQNILRNLSSK